MKKQHESTKPDTGLNRKTPCKNMLEQNCLYTCRMFSRRGDIFVRISHRQNLEMSVYGLLEKAAIRLMTESSNRKSDAKGERFFYRRYVYCRMLWSEFSSFVYSIWCTHH